MGMEPTRCSRCHHREARPDKKYCVECSEYFRVRRQARPRKRKKLTADELRQLRREVAAETLTDMSNRLWAELWKRGT